MRNHIRFKEEYQKHDDTKNQYTHWKVHVMEDGKSCKCNQKMNQDDEKFHGEIITRKRREEIVFIVANRDILRVNVDSWS